MNNAERKRATHEAILRAARAEFAASGFAAASMQAVSGGAGVANGTVFWHFTSKPRLYVEVVRQVADELEAEVGDGDGGAPSLRALERRLGFLERNPEAGGLIASLPAASVDPELARGAAVFEDRLFRLCRRAVEMPDESGGSCPPARRDELARTTAALVCGLLAVGRPEPPPLRLLAGFVELAELAYETPEEERPERLAAGASG